MRGARKWQKTDVDQEKIVFDVVKPGCESVRCTTTDEGPRKAMKTMQLDRMSVAENKVWLESARLEAVLGSCRRSLPSVRSGLRCYVAFVKAIVGTRVESLFPPRLEWLQAWAALFRSSRTFTNYLGYARVGCMIVKADTSIFDHPAVTRAIRSVEKAGLFAAREKMWIRRERIEAMLCWAELHTEYLQYAYLFLLAYVFLLRLPSEALPVVSASVEGQVTSQSVITVTETEIVLNLKRRKNKSCGSRLIRRCWCKQSTRTCPIHVLGKFVQTSPHGSELFSGVTAAGALSALRFMLKSLGVAGHESYRTHDLRRGHALDLQCSGAPLWEILEAGEWTSPAFLKYLDLHRLDTELVVQAHAGESESDDE